VRSGDIEPQELVDRVLTRGSGSAPDLSVRQSTQVETSIHVGHSGAGPHASGLTGRVDFGLLTNLRSGFWAENRLLLSRRGRRAGSEPMQLFEGVGRAGTVADESGLPIHRLRM
jgi:hypothetical protein